MNLSEMPDQEKDLVKRELLTLCSSGLLRPLSKPGLLDVLFDREKSEDVLDYTTIRSVTASFRVADCGQGLLMEVEVRERTETVGSSYYKIGREFFFSAFSDEVRKQVDEQERLTYASYGA